MIWKRNNVINSYKEVTLSHNTNALKTKTGMNSSMKHVIKDSILCQMRSQIIGTKSSD